MSLSARESDQAGAELFTVVGREYGSGGCRNRKNCDGDG